MINGVTWATRNVDAPGIFAAKAEDYGMFYQWNRKTAWAATGDVTGWDNTNATGDSWESANAPCPSGWRVPTSEEQSKLFETSVTNEWVTSPANGRKFTETTSGKSIFFPAAGYRFFPGNGSLNLAGVSGGYWSSTMTSVVSARYLVFNSDYSGQVNSGRSYGYTVRCVLQ